MRNSASKCMKDENNFLRNFPALPLPKRRLPCQTPVIRLCSNGRSLICRNAGGMPNGTPCIGTLLRLRREDPIIGKQARERVDGAVIGLQAFVMRYFGEDEDDRLLIVNLGADLRYMPAPEPLLAPSPRGPWGFVWSSDAPRYGGPGIVEPLSEEGWLLPEGRLLSMPRNADGIDGSAVVVVDVIHHGETEASGLQRMGSPQASWRT